MAEGFKKYFNGTTINGRANVAKATYATLAVFYLLYRVRRGKAAASKEAVELAAEKDNCNCDDGKNAPNKHCEPQVEPQPPEKQCSVCRDRASERRARDEGSNNDPPPPPPPTAGAGAAPRRKCPCEDPHRHIETPKPTTHQPPNVRSAPGEDQVHPAREIIGHMQQAATRALRNVFGAVIGESANASSSSSSAAADNNNLNSSSTLYEEKPSYSAAHQAAAAGAAAEPLNAVDEFEDDGSSDYGGDNQLLDRQRRTAPRSCVPTTGSSCDPQLVLPIEQEPQELFQSQSQSQQQSQSQPRFRGFEDDFASEMFFQDFEE
ncbi:hypothetical protein KR044_000870 [Drosophila immigrans]|nr:hypothetical protein KR044_000870 [Drosophila immigrans]